MNFLGTILHPTLGIRLDKGQVELFRPTSFTGLHGPKAPSLSGSIQWSNLVSQPMGVGSEVRVTDGPPVGRQFYRRSP